MSRVLGTLLRDFGHGHPVGGGGGDGLMSQRDTEGRVDVAFPIGQRISDTCRTADRLLKFGGLN